MKPTLLAVIMIFASASMALVGEETRGNGWQDESMAIEVQRNSDVLYATNSEKKPVVTRIRTLPEDGSHDIVQELEVYVNLRAEHVDIYNVEQVNMAEVFGSSKKIGGLNLLDTSILVLTADVNQKESGKIERRNNRLYRLRFKARNGGVVVIPQGHISGIAISWEIEVKKIENSRTYEWSFKNLNIEYAVPLSKFSRDKGDS